MEGVITSPHEPIPYGAIHNQIFRFTVGCACCFPEGKLLLVRSVHSMSDDRQHSWMLPQEGVKLKTGSDVTETMVETAIRCIYEELGYVVSREVFSDARILGWMCNQIAQSRLKGGRAIKYKLIGFLGVFFPEKFPIHLNTTEVAEYAYVSSFTELQEYLQEVKRHNYLKYYHTLDKVIQACVHRFLPWKDLEWPEQNT